MNPENNDDLYNLERFNCDFAKESLRKKRNFKKSLKDKLFNLKPYKLFTIIKWLSEYDVKKCLVNDLISGLTVGVMHIPQGLAYGALTGLSPIYGLYTSFFPGLVYMFFGTSKHLSVGTFAIVSLMIYSSLIRHEANYANNSLETFNNTSNISQTSDTSLQIRLNISMSLAFWVGIIQILFAIFKIGSITKYLSSALLKGFTTAAAVHVVTSQLTHVFGIYKPIKRQTYFQIINNYVIFIENFNSINLISLAISIVSITLITVVRIHINERFKKQMKSIPIPTELFVIIVGTLITYFLKLDKTQKLSVVGTVPVGLPAPKLPDFGLVFDILPDAIVIAILAYASSISAAEIYAKKHNYKVNPNQEFFALGISNAISSFFQCFASSAALARTALFESSGGKSQLVTGIASVVVLLVLLWIAPLFEMLPKACLGSIIIASLINLLLQARDLPRIWKNDKIDFLTWIVAFSASIIMNIDYGFFISVIAVMFLNTYRSQKLKIVKLGEIKESSYFVNIEKYKSNEIDSIKILRLSNSLFYINADSFKSQLQSIIPLKNFETNHNCFSQCKCFRKKEKMNKTDGSQEEQSEENGKENLKIEFQLKFIILDLSGANHIDEVSVKILKEIINDYKKDQIEILLVCSNDMVFEKMDKLKCLKDTFDKIIFLSISDAVCFAKARL